MNTSARTVNISKTTHACTTYVLTSARLLNKTVGLIALALRLSACCICSCTASKYTTSSTIQISNCSACYRINTDASFAPRCSGYYPTSGTSALTIIIRIKARLACAIPGCSIHNIIVVSIAIAQRLSVLWSCLSCTASKTTTNISCS